MVWSGRCGLIRALEAWLRTVTSDSRGQCGDMKEECGRMCCGRFSFPNAPNRDIRVLVSTGIIFVESPIEPITISSRAGWSWPLGKCSAEGVTRRNRSTGPKLRDQLPQAEVQVPSQQCLVCLVAVADCQQFTKCRIQQCELINVFTAPFVALRDLNAHSFMITLQGRQRGSLLASTGCGWQTDATDSWLKTSRSPLEATQADDLDSRTSMQEH